MNTKYEHILNNLRKQREEWRRKINEHDAAIALLRECRDELAKLPSSFGYEYTHIRKIDEFLKEIERGPE